LGYDPHVDRHFSDANPHPDLDRHQKLQVALIHIGIKTMQIPNPANFKNDNKRKSKQKNRLNTYRRKQKIVMILPYKKHAFSINHTTVVTRCDKSDGGGEVT
jgi:hypothetical protein